MGKLGTILAGAMAGGGAAAVNIWSDERKQELAAELQGKRDTILSALRRGDMQFGEELKRESKIAEETRGRAEYAGAVGEVEKFRTTPLVAGEPGDDAISRMPTDKEAKNFRRTEFAKRGLMSPRELEAAEEAERRNDILDTRYAEEADWRNRRADIEDRRWTRQFELQERRINADISRHGKLNKEQQTALTTNVRFMVENGIAADPAEAFEKLRTRMGSSPEAAITSMVNNLLRSGAPQYRGKDGRNKAVEDARNIVDSIRGANDDAFAAGFNRNAPIGPGARTSIASGGSSAFESAEDVRAAFRAKVIDRATAVRELQRFGFE